jgi:hypothetical protein
VYCAEDGAGTAEDETDGATAALVEVAVGTGAVCAELVAVETTAVELLDGATNVLVEEVLRVDDGTATWVEDGRVLEVEVDVDTADEITVDDGAVVEVEVATLLTTAVLLVEVELPCEIDTL